MTHASGGGGSRLPKGFTMREAVEHAKAQMEKHRKALTPAARKLARQGRGSDTEVAHVARGELVVPRALQNPEVLAVLSRAAAAHNVPLEMLRVGNAMNRINPRTGAPEFGAMDWANGFSSDVGASVRYDNAGIDNILADINTQIPPANNGQAYVPPSAGVGSMPLPYEPNLPPQAENWPTNYGDQVKGDYGPRDTFNDFHNGLDFRNRLNDPVYSAVDGRVHSIGPDPNQRAGTYITVRDKGGNLYGYAHSGVSEGIEVGRDVKAGDQIGFSNGTGRTPQNNPVSPHLHMTFRAASPQFSATMKTPYSNPNEIFRRLRMK